VPGQEKDNANFFEKEGMAIVTKSEEEIAPAVLSLLKQPLLARSISKQMETHFHPNSAALIVDKVLTLIEKPYIQKEPRHDSKEIKN
ncbi:MAG: diacylglycerol glucosyltransferase, partial [Carnobacterium inhibens]